MLKYTEWIKSFSNIGSLIDEGLAAISGIEISQVGGSHILTLPVPGFKARDIYVFAIDGKLVVEGENKKYGSFRETIPLASSVNVKSGVATVSDGILTITFSPHQPPQEKYVIAVSES